MATTPAATDWLLANQQHLMAALAVVRARLDRHAAGHQPQNGASDEADAAPRACPELPAVTPALDTLCGSFSLSPFERDIILLCAGVELDASIAGRCAAAHGDAARPYPTFSLALAALDAPHWSALEPGAPLRRWKLIEIGQGDALTTSPLKIDERILHYLAGVQRIDERIAPLVEPMTRPHALVDSQKAATDYLAALWSQQARTAPLPFVELQGSDAEGLRTIAAAASRAAGLVPTRMASRLMPQAVTDIETLARLWEREWILGSRLLVIDGNEMDGDRLQAAAVIRFVDRLAAPVVLLRRDRSVVPQRSAIILEVPKSNAREQLSIWREHLGTAWDQLDGHAGALVSQFSLTAPQIAAACTQARTNRLSDGEASPERVVDDLWEACRRQARPALADLAVRLRGTAGWRDLILPEAVKTLLMDIAAHVRQRHRVYETWGFGARGARGLGISVVFAGASGTGKTMAAEVLANELRLDLHRVDLSQVVSKYIGETEKNLRRVFDAAEAGGAILLFDEADALFGKRSEVKDSHDRYANIEVSYLLQQMEAYRGLAILTTNMKDAIDAAFLRRIRFLVEFPFPDAALRSEIWRRVFPAATPIEDLDFEKLAQLNVTGGSIRNIALGAAFQAADAGAPVSMAHLLRAVRLEYAKLQRPLTAAELRGWV